MKGQLQPQLKNAQEIKNTLKEVQTSFKLYDGRDVKTLLIYLPIKNGESNHADFFEQVKEGILYNFVLSHSEIEKKHGINGNEEATKKLFEKAIRKISQHTAKGELGELILFTLLDVYFKAPKILSKVSLKTNSKMPVFGADAVHGQFQEDHFNLYLGESKLHQDFKPAATDAAKSIKNAKSKYEEEFDLLDSYIDFPNMDNELESKLLSLLDPFSDNDLSNVIYSPCFIGFSEPEIISKANSEDEFIQIYTNLACDYIGHFFDRIEKQGLTINETALLLLPFSDINKLVEEFISHIGIKK